MTPIEAVVVIFVIGVLVLTLFPARRQPRHPSYISCTFNLKQVVLAEKIWAGDNNDKYPMEVSTNSGGAMEWMTTPDGWKAYLVMSNELSTPKNLFCPQDILHGNMPTNWGDDLKNKISYFVGVDARNTNSAAFLSGDGNFLLNGTPANHGLVNVALRDSLKWDTTRHYSKTPDGLLYKTRTGSGNIALTDGSVQSATGSDLATYLHQTGFATNRFFVP